MDDETENLPQYTGPDSFAGLPGRAAAPAKDSRPGMSYTLPKPDRLDAITWARSNRPDVDLTFKIVQLMPEEQDAAAQLANNVPAKLGQELVLQVIRKVGDRTMNPIEPADRAALRSWWDDIGPKSRQLIQLLFLDLSHPSEGEVATFRASGVVS